MLWRACRGNVFLRQAEIESPLEDPVTVSHGVIVLLFNTMILLQIFFYVLVHMVMPEATMVMCSGRTALEENRIVKQGS